MSGVFSLETYFAFYLFFVFEVVRQLRGSFFIFPAFSSTSLIPMEAIDPVIAAAVCAQWLLPGVLFICLGYKYAAPSPAQRTQVYRSNPHNNPNTFRLVRQALFTFQHW